MSTHDRLADTAQPASRESAEEAAREERAIQRQVDKSDQGAGKYKNEPGAKKRRGELGLRLSFEGGTSSSNPSSSSKESGANSRRIGAYKVPQSEVGVILWSLSASAHERR